MLGYNDLMFIKQLSNSYWPDGNIWYQRSYFSWFNSLRPSDAYIFLSKINIIGSDNGFVPGQHQAIIRTIVGILLIWPIGTNFSEILIDIPTFSFNKMHLQISYGKCQPFCLSRNVLSNGLVAWSAISSYQKQCWYVMNNTSNRLVYYGQSLQKTFSKN